MPFNERKINKPEQGPKILIGKLEFYRAIEDSCNQYNHLISVYNSNDLPEKKIENYKSKMPNYMDFSEYLLSKNEVLSDTLQKNKIVNNFIKEYNIIIEQIKSITSYKDMELAVSNLTKFTDVIRKVKIGSSPRI